MFLELLCALTALGYVTGLGLPSSHSHSPGLVAPRCESRGDRPGILFLPGIQADGFFSLLQLFGAVVNIRFLRPIKKKVSTSSSRGGGFLKKR